MMRFYKVASGGYILLVGEGENGTETTEEEYNEILSCIKNAPPPIEGKAYRLREDLTWEEYPIDHPQEALA